MANNESQRKLTYDPHSRCFVFETKMEALDRVCGARAKKAETMNRNEEVQLGSYKKLIQQEEHIISQKRHRQMNEVRESLREHVAYRRVLDRIRDRNDRDVTHQDKYGQYGMGTSRSDLVPLLDEELKHMSPQEKRRKEVKRLLKQRKQPELLDRTLPDDAILRKRNRQNDVIESTSISSEERKRPKLVLPPLTVSMATFRRTNNGSTGSAESAGKRSDVDDVIDDASHVSLPSIFMTDSM